MVDKDLANHRVNLRVYDVQNNFQYNMTYDELILQRYQNDEYFYKDIYYQVEHAVKEKRKTLGVDEATGNKKVKYDVTSLPSFAWTDDDLDRITKEIERKQSTIKNKYDAFGEERRTEERKKLPKYGRY